MKQANSELLRIPIKYIITENNSGVDVVKALELSQFYLTDKDNLNSIPITVVPETGGTYRLIKGQEIYHALLNAGKEWVLALNITDNGNSSESWKYELGLERKKINVCTLDATEFQTIFEYLQANVKKLSTINVDKLATLFANDTLRRYWSDLDILIEAKCGITKAKLPLLNAYLLASPDLSDLEPLSSIDINRASEDNIVNQIQRLKIEPKAGKLRKIDSVATARMIVADENRIYWASSKHLVKAKVGITTALWPMLEIGFFFKPDPAPEPNTSKFLLNQLTISKLRNEAKTRNFDPTGLRKGDLVELLS